jgi:hypothetical protein
MKKVKQKQKQKQSQTVNINLGNVLKKKSKPRRKPQPKQPSPLAAPITFNAPPIREYVDTSLYNIPSRLENPLLIRQPVNPILPENPILQPVNTVGPIQSNNPLFQDKPKELKITDEPINNNPIFLEELPGYTPQFNLNKPNRQLNDYEIELQKKLIQIQKENSIKKKEETARLKEENKKIKREKILQKKREKDALSQTDMLNYVTKPSVSIKKDIQNYSVKPEETQSITSAPQEPQTIFSAPPQQENITSLPIFYQMQTESNLPTEQYVPNMSPQEELAFNNKINKAPTKKRPPEEGKKIVAKPIKLDADGNPIKKPKKEKLPENAPLKLIIPPNI